MLKKSAGTNLTELLIVVVIVGILAGIAVPRMVSFNSAAQDAAFQAAAGVIKSNALGASNALNESNIQTANSFTTSSAPMGTYHDYVVYYTAIAAYSYLGNRPYVPALAQRVVSPNTVASVEAGMQASVSAGTYQIYNSSGQGGNCAGESSSNNYAPFSSCYGNIWQSSTQCANLWSMLASNSDGSVPPDLAGGTAVTDSTFCSQNANNQCNYVISTFSHTSGQPTHGCLATQYDSNGNATGRYIVVDWMSVPIVQTQDTSPGTALNGLVMYDYPTSQEILNTGGNPMAASSFSSSGGKGGLGGSGGGAVVGGTGVGTTGSGIVSGTGGVAPTGVGIIRKK